MSALGEMFRTARESQGLTLSDVADRVHIRSVYLAAIEAEDWQAIGPAVYIRGFIRTYARILGLDADAAVARFGSSTTPVVLAPSPRGEPSRSGLPRGDGRKPGPSIWAVLGAVIAIALVVIAGYEYVEYRRGNATDARGAVAGATPATAPRPLQKSRTSIARTAPEVHASSENGLRSSGLVVRIKDSSWLRVVVDGKVATEGVLRAGTSRSFSGRSMTIRTGNAGGVDLIVDGKDLGPMGGSGDVAERSFQR